MDTAMVQDQSPHRLDSTPDGQAKRKHKATNKQPVTSIPADQELLNVDQVAFLLNCSVRNVWRQSDIGNMPRPVKMAGKTLWVRRALREWMDDGCRPVR